MKTRTIQPLNSGALAHKGKLILRNWQLYILLLPTVVYFIIFHYVPMLGVQIAFKDFMSTKGIWGSPWVGLKHFARFFTSFNFEIVLSNTVLLSVAQLIFSFPIPILLALMLNQLKSKRFKSFVQTVTYAPHFISIVVLVGMMLIFCSPDTGIINIIMKSLGMDSIYFFAKENWFLPMYVISGIWQGTGWSSIIYLAALAGIDPTLHEAAMVDGASKLKRILHIDLPGIAPTVITMLVLEAGRMMNIGFEKAFLMQTPLNLDASELISTYVYKVGLLNIQYSYSTAIGLFNSLINLLLILLVNRGARKFTESSLW